jgi:hypothetical protein
MRWSSPSSLISDAVPGSPTADPANVSYGWWIAVIGFGPQSGHSDVSQGG